MTSLLRCWHLWMWFFLSSFFSLNAQVLALYLSIPPNPFTSMIIQWHTTPDQTDNSIVFGTPDTQWKTVVGEYTQDGPALIHKTLLEDLTPDTEYSFRIGALHKVYHFRTPPLDLNAPYSYIIYAPENPFPSTCWAVSRHIKGRGDNLFGESYFYYFPPYPPTTPPNTSTTALYPFNEDDPIRESCEKTRALFQRIYTPHWIPDPLSAQAQTAGSGEKAKSLFHIDPTDYAGPEKQEEFDAYQKQSVSIVAKVFQSIVDPEDFSLYAVLHAIGTLRLKMCVDTEAGDPLQLGKWRAKGPAESIYEDDPYKYLVVSAITPIPLNSRYHRYNLRMQTTLPQGTPVVYTRGTLEGMEMQLSGIWEKGIEHASAIHTVTIINSLEKNLRKLLARTPYSRSAWLRDLAPIHWWLAHLMPFYRGSASCTEILIQALVVAKGYPPPRLAGLPSDDAANGILFADLEAIYLPLDQFVDQYVSMTERLQ